MQRGGGAARRERVAMDAQEVALVAVLPAEQLLAALTDSAHVPARSGAESPPLVQQAIVCQRNIPDQMAEAIRQTWPQIQMLGTADWAPMERLLGHAGVPAAAMGLYRAVWQQGDAILVLPGLPGERRTVLEQALAPYLRAGSLTLGAGGRPDEPTAEPPAFAVYRRRAPAETAAQALGPPESV